MEYNRLWLICPFFQYIKEIVVVNKMAASLKSNKNMYCCPHLQILNQLLLL